MSLPDGATVRPSGERAVVIEFGDRIDADAQSAVRRLTNALDAAPPPGLIEAVPTFRSVLLSYDPRKTIAADLLANLPDIGGPDEAGSASHWSVPVCVDDTMAEDLAELCQAVGLAASDVRARLLASTFSVGMYGFVPGAAYLTGLDPALATPRRATPRSPIPAGSLIVAVGQAVICPVSMPTGWYVVGQTAAPMFDPAATPPVPFAVGDTLTLRAVEAAELDALRSDPSGGVRRA